MITLDPSDLVIITTFRYFWEFAHGESVHRTRTQPTTAGRSCGPAAAKRDTRTGPRRMASWRRLQRQNPNEVLSLLFGATSVEEMQKWKLQRKRAREREREWECRMTYLLLQAGTSADNPYGSLPKGAKEFLHLRLARRIRRLASCRSTHKEQAKAAISRSRLAILQTIRTKRMVLKCKAIQDPHPI